MSGRVGSSGHQNLIRMASKKLLNKIIGDKYLSVTLVREQHLKISSNVGIHGESFGARSIVDTQVDLYADIACAAVFDAGASWIGDHPINPEMIEIAQKKLAAGDRQGYYEAVRSAYGVMIYIIECEINPTSNLLRDGPKLTAYQLLKQKNNHVVLILAVFEDTKVDNPQVFDHIWRFPRKK